MAAKQMSMRSENADLLCYQPETTGQGWQTSLPQITHTLSAAFPSALACQPLLICTLQSLRKKAVCVFA